LFIDRRTPARERQPIEPECLDLNDDSLAYLKNRRFLELAAIALSAPILVMACCLLGLAVWFESGLPILIRQPRCGRHGRIFGLYKLRSMYSIRDSLHGAPSDAELVSHNDSRVTHIGAFLRNHRLDELPQMWNVLKGEMSLIGPRPEPAWLSCDYERHIPNYVNRRIVLPGLTGWAQVNLDYTQDLEGERQKLEFDLYYISHLSLRLDLDIVLRTMHIMLIGV